MLAPLPADVTALARLSPGELDALRDEGYFVRDQFLGEESVAAVRQGALSLLPHLKRAGTGRDARLDDTRSDHITFLQPQVRAPPPPLRSLLDAFLAMRACLNESGRYDLKGTEVQVSRYPGDGTKYSRHVDAYADTDNRKVTAIYYLNPGWRPVDGGELRLFLRKGLDAPHRDIEPSSDRLVVFESERHPHEVRPTFADRYAITCWFYHRR